MAIESPLYLHNGEMLLNGGEMVEVPSDCCCVGTPCSECSGSTPASVSVTFSGLSLCTGCQAGSFGTYYRITGLTVPTGPYTVPQSIPGIDPCHFQYSEAVSGTYEIFGDVADCPDTPSNSWDVTAMNIIVRFEVGTLSVSGYYTGSFSGQIDFYKSQESRPGTCAGPWSETNTIVACDFTASPIEMGYGGTASVV
ncbi:MAG: hypothetical protein GY807_24860 [Gammaproteobacteria bacterium]|nr:hypothetical protein [Gammaproteobacteria bacterium]